MEELTSAYDSTDRAIIVRRASESRW
jgi:hypothetical protein